MNCQLVLKTYVVAALIAAAICHAPSAALAQGTAFSYQGRLNNGANPANGSYDLRFALYDAASAGIAQGNLLTNAATAVSNGLFAVTLDFGNQFPGANRWLEIAVRTNGGGAFSTLTPRQPLSATPYAVYAANAGSATTAAFAGSAGSLSAANLSGTLTTTQLPAGTMVITTNAFSIYQNLARSLNDGLGAVTNLDLSISKIGTANHLRFNDTVGSEEVFLHAVKNLNLETVNDATFWAGHDFLTTIDHDFTFHVKHNENFTVDNNLTDTIGLNYSLSVGNALSETVGGSMELSIGSNLGIFTGGGVGLGTISPVGRLHVYSADNPTVVRIQSTGTPGFGRLEFVSNPQGDPNEWRPGFIQSTDAGNFTGGLAFFVNGAGSNNKFSTNEVMRIQNGQVGIGVSNPTTKLQVAGVVSAAASSSEPFEASGAASGYALLDRTTGATGRWVMFATGGTLGFFSGGTTRMSVSAGGTVTATAFNPPSDRNLKENFVPVSPREVLEKVAGLPISRWNFKEDKATPHVGPMAQDFHAAFGLGTDDRHIATVDADGVALAAIQGLNEKVEARSKKLEAENAALKTRLEKLEALLEQRLSSSR